MYHLTGFAVTPRRFGSILGVFATPYPAWYLPQLFLQGGWVRQSQRCLRCLKFRRVEHVAQGELFPVSMLTRTRLSPQYNYVLPDDNHGVPAAGRRKAVHVLERVTPATLRHVKDPKVLEILAHL